MFDVPIFRQKILMSDVPIPMFTTIEDCFTFFAQCICFVLFPTDVTTIKHIISIPCLFICTHIQIVAHFLFITCEFV